MEIIAIPCGPVMANSYIVRREGSPTCAVIDPADARLICDELQKKGLACTHILLTHGHFDHVWGAADLKTKTGAKVYIHEADASMAEGKASYTPGHTKGGVCYIVDDEQVVFTGDTLFCESVGRTDLGGNMRELMDSLFHKLYALEGFTVYPGHEESTTIEHEKQFNPMNAYRDHPWFS